MEEKHLTRYCYNYHTNPMKNGQLQKTLQKTGEIAIYQSKDRHIILEARLIQDTIWLTQSQIAILFGTQRPAITKHLNNIFGNRELHKKSVSSILELTAADGKAYKTQFYNLDAIISVGLESVAMEAFPIC